MSKKCSKVKVYAEANGRKRGVVGANKTGTDYFTGDIHGGYSILMKVLEDIGFDKECDRLFCTGDLIDRGGESMKCLGLLDEPWFFTVKGNHEELMEYTILQNDLEAYHVWVSNGGYWHTVEDNDVLVDFAKELRELPHTLTIDDEITVVHADYYGKDTTVESMLWGRDRIKRRQTDTVEGVKAVVCGHTPREEITVLGNVVYIDTGTVYCNGNCTVVSKNEILRRVGL